MSGSSGGDKPPDSTNPNQPGPNQTSFSTTSAWALGGVVGSEVKMRNFAEIIAEDKLSRNILEIHLVKPTTVDKDEATRVKTLTYYL